MLSMFVLSVIALATVAFGVSNLDRLFNAAQGQAGKFTKSSGVAGTLLERASAMEGQNPREAMKLRQSALAFLSVAR